MPRPARPKHSFDIKFATLEEFSEICRKKSNSSAPGLNGIPYLLYKRCDQVRRLLWTLLQRIWVERKIPSTFQVGRVRLLPKSSDTSHPKHMTYLCFELRRAAFLDDISEEPLLLHVEQWLHQSPLPEGLFRRGGWLYRDGRCYNMPNGNTSRSQWHGLTLKTLMVQ